MPLRRRSPALSILLRASPLPKIYCSAGVLFVTSRILVMDLLLEKVPTELITGLVVLNAHRVQ